MSRKHIGVGFHIESAAAGFGEALRNGESQTAAFLFGIRWREIERQPCHREEHLAARHRRAHALAAFLHRRIRQSHNVKPRQTVGNIALNRNLVTVHAKPISVSVCSGSLSRPFSRA